MSADEQEYLDYLASVENTERNDAQMVYDLKPWDVQCRWCGATATGSQRDLKKQGWSLTKHGEYCPKEVVRVGAAWEIADMSFEAGVQVGRAQKLNEQGPKAGKLGKFANLECPF